MDKSIDSALIILFVFILACHFIALIIRTYVDKRALRLYTEKKMEMHQKDNEQHEVDAYMQQLIQDGYKGREKDKTSCRIIKFHDPKNRKIIDKNRKDLT